MKRIGLVLAGGKSSRMGTDKASLKFGNGTMLDAQFDLLRSFASLDEVYVSGVYPGFECIEDIVQQAGPVGGIASALKKFETEDVLFFIVPVDMPLLSRDIFGRLLSTATGAPAYDAYQFTGFEMPLVLRNAPRVCETVSFLLNHREDKKLVSIRNLLCKINTCKLDVTTTEKKNFENLNTRFDYEKAVQGECQDIL